MLFMILVFLVFTLVFIAFIIFIIISSINDDFVFPKNIKRFSNRTLKKNFYDSNFKYKKNQVKTANQEDDFYKKLDSGFYDDDPEILQTEDFETYQEIFGDDLEDGN